MSTPLDSPPPGPPSWSASADAWSEPSSNSSPVPERNNGVEKEVLRVTITERKETGGNLFTRHKVFFVKQNSNGVVVERRYSNFTTLNSILTRRYPFRLLPILPPKKVSLAGSYITDKEFIERRIRGLERYLGFAINHPILQKDDVLIQFLTLNSEFSTYVATTKISLDEESQTRVLNLTELNSVPEDLEVKLNQLRARIMVLITHWSNISIHFEKVQKLRMEEKIRLEKLKNTLELAVETERMGWRNAGDAVERDELCVAEHFGKAGEILGSLGGDLILSASEELKRHLGLYLSHRDLIIRHGVQSLDAVDKLRKTVEGKLIKVELLRTSQKATDETILLATIASIEIDQNQIESLLTRRHFIRFCLWEELLYLFKESNRFSTFMKGAAEIEKAFAERMVGNWKLLSESL